MHNVYIYSSISLGSDLVPSTDDGDEEGDVTAAEVIGL